MKLTELEVSLGRIDERLKHLEAEVHQMSVKLEKSYITESEFRIVRRVVYGSVGIVLSFVLTAIMAFVFKTL